MKKNVLKDLTMRIVDLKLKAESLPSLPPNEEAKIEQSIAIDHLYYSSALEGSRLNEEQIKRVAYEGFSAA